MARSQFGPRQVRSLMRAFHLVLSVATGVLLYAQGAISDSVARNGIAFVIFPLLFVTGAASAAPQVARRQAGRCRRPRQCRIARPEPHRGHR
jgi:hypothetical protein